MNFGLLMSFRNSSRNELSYSDLYGKHVDLCVQAEELGFDTIWLTEHHFVDDGYSPSVLPLAAAIASRTKKIRIGTFVLLMPLHNPLRVAEDAATIDVLSHGRFDLGLGQGYVPAEFTAFNVPREERSRRLREGVEIVRRVFTEDHVTFEGKCYTVRDVTLYPKPVQKPHPPIWIGARSRQATERAARYGYHLAGTGSRQVEIYRDALVALGRNPDDFQIAQLRFGFIAAKKEKAWDDCEFALHYLLTRYGQWIAESADVPGDENFAKVPPVGELRKASDVGMIGDGVMVGTPDDAIAQIEGIENYCTHLALGLALPGIDSKKVRASMKLFAENVIPHFRGRSRMRTLGDASGHRVRTPPSVTIAVQDDARRSVMSTDFVEIITKRHNLSPIESAVLRSVGVRSYEDVDSLIRSFPSIHKAGVRIPLLSSVSAPHIGAHFAALAANVAVPQRRPMVATGAVYPSGAQWAIGTSVPTPSAAAAAPSPPPAGQITGGRIDLRFQNWRVRNQGNRGTCVAFAATALDEHRRASNAAVPDMSEQFLYWAIKTNTADPQKNSDGTLLKYARDAIKGDGICEESLWQYVGTFYPSNISHGAGGNPSPAAVADAAKNKFSTGSYQIFNSPGTGAAAVLNLLQKGHPVAVTVPVFTDPAAPGNPNNWETGSSWAYGRVLNPPPTAVVSLSGSPGHAVCIVGFEPDASELAGGYFIIRNSWDVTWATMAPSQGNSYSPEPGYGDISATYIDNYLWELLQF